MVAKAGKCREKMTKEKDDDAKDMHRKKMRFHRWFTSAKYPKSLKGETKEDVFKVWLNHGEDKAKVHITFLKRRVHQKKATEVKVFMKPRDLKTKLGYTAEKIKTIVAQCKKDGTWRKDKLFPKDEEENRYMVEIDPTLEEADLFESGMEAKGSADFEGDAAEDMLEGMLGGEGQQDGFDLGTIKDDKKPTKGDRKLARDSTTPKAI
eukprot:8706581-Pyramimonas_sp.AAC.1